jgi:hypothetical protein
VAKFPHFGGDTDLAEGWLRARFPGTLPISAATV